MTHFPTCTGCAKKPTCVHLAFMKDHLAGLYISTAKHRCTVREPEYKPGDQVLALTVAEMNTEDLWPERRWFRATFIRELPDHKTQVIIFIKAGTESDSDDKLPFMPNGLGFVKLPRSRVKKLDLPPIPLLECKTCGAIPELTGDCFCQKELNATLATEWRAA